MNKQPTQEQILSGAEIIIKAGIMRAYGIGLQGKPLEKNIGKIAEEILQAVLKKLAGKTDEEMVEYLRASFQSWYEEIRVRLIDMNYSAKYEFEWQRSLAIFFKDALSYIKLHLATRHEADKAQAVKEAVEKNCLECNMNPIVNPPIRGGKVNARE